LKTVPIKRIDTREKKERLSHLSPFRGEKRREERNQRKEEKSADRGQMSALTTTGKLREFLEMFLSIPLHDGTIVFSICIWRYPRIEESHSRLKLIGSSQPAKCRWVVTVLWPLRGQAAKLK